MKNKIILFLLCIYQLSIAQTGNKLWQPISESAIRSTGKRLIIPQKYKTFHAATSELKNLLGTAPSEQNSTLANSPVTVELPMPDGSFQRFRIVESPVMAPELAAQFPSIRTYNVMGIDQPGTYGKLDFTELGFHAMLLGRTGTVFIDPYSYTNYDDYISYYAADFVKNEIAACQINGQSIPQKDLNEQMNAVICSGANLRTYRLAVSCTGEYAQAATGTATPTPVQVLSAVTTTIARVDGVYETEAAVKLQLISAEAALLFTDPLTDPFNGNNNAGLLIDESQRVIDSIAGAANYDIGHTFSTGGGGLAGLGVVCKAGEKARGITGSSSPVGDPYDIDYVCHEIGHQFGCNHSYNQCTSNATQHAGTMVEPGSGITIMGYAGICAAKDNLNTNSIAYFHSISFDELMAYSNTGTGNSCAVITASGNAVPVVENIPTYTIPKLTAFELKGKATDANNDPLTYSWEETDNNDTPHDLGLAAPYFKSYPPSNSANRVFIPMANLLLGQTGTLGEYLPSTAQELNFRLTARDNKMGGGGVCYAACKLIIADVAPFKVTSQNTPVTWSACKTEKITWDAGGTNAAPVNTALVDIFFTIDGGTTLLTIVSGVPNNGSCNITVPTVSTTKGRVIIKGVNNAFLAVNAADITVSGLCADFEARFNGVLKTSIEKGDALVYKDLSVGNPSSWNWIFEGGTPATSTSQNPTVIYNVPGTFKVELRITNGTSKDSVIKKNYVSVGATYNKGTAYTCVAIDSAKNIWAGTNKKGVFFLDKKGNPSATQFNLQAYSGTFDPAKFVIQSIACDSLGNTWVAHGGTGNTTGTTGGMERIDYNNPATIQHYTPTSQTRCFSLGDNDGLATRNIQCVVVDKNNTVWTAHRYHDLTTSPDYFVTPGSFSYKKAGATLFTSRSSWEDYKNKVEPSELPYPAFTCNPKTNETAQSRTCTAIACGPTEMWVSVFPYQAINGASFPARILRYDLNGNYTGSSIDFGTIGIPAGGVFNGIYLSPKGDAWVTVSAGKGFAVKIQGAWKYIKPADMPCVFPAGATINQNAIWGNKFGNVFIGTTKGLIVYNGDGNVNSASSYSFYGLVKDAGGNRNVTGGVSENDSIQWIATDDGIVRSVIGRYDMTKSDVDYTSCNNVDMNTVETSLKNGENDLSYHNYPVETIICDRKSTKYPDKCNAEFVYGMIKSDATLTAPIPADYPSNILDMFTNEHNILFSYVVNGPLLSTISALTNAELTSEQSSFNPSTPISCSPYRLYGNVNSVILHMIYDAAPAHKYFRDCNWLWFVNPTIFVWDINNSMDDYCGNQLLNTKYDPIWMFVNDKKKMITNYTGKGHILYPGKIERTVVEECGVVKVVTRGVGLQYCGNNCRGKTMGFANTKLGTFLFMSVDRRLKEKFEK